MKRLNKEQLQKVVGGQEIINASNLEEKLEELRGIYKLLEDRKNNAASYKEALEIMDQMVKILQEINEVEQEIQRNQ